MITPLSFIAMLRDLYPGRYADESGGCLKFHRLMKAVFPDANGFYDSNHVITEIDGEYFDIDGLIEDPVGYLPIEDFGAEYIESAFRDMVHLQDV